jgi:hypothetical protein
MVSVGEEGLACFGVVPDERSLRSNIHGARGISTIRCLCMLVAKRGGISKCDKACKAGGGDVAEGVEADGDGSACGWLHCGGCRRDGGSRRGGSPYAGAGVERHGLRAVVDRGAGWPAHLVDACDGFSDGDGVGGCQRGGSERCAQSGETHLSRSLG